MTKKTFMTTDPKQNLLDLMKHLSQAGMCAQWDYNCEFWLWKMAQEGKPVSYGLIDISKQQLLSLKEYAKRADGWWIWDKKTNDITFIKFANWIQIYEEWRIPK